MHINKTILSILPLSNFSDDRMFGNLIVSYIDTKDIENIIFDFQIMDFSGQLTIQ